MSLYEGLYLGLVISAFVLFGVVLAAVTWIEREWAVGRGSEAALKQARSEVEHPVYRKAA